jgi:hypothetical protein
MGSERSVVRARTSAAAGATEPTATRVAAAPGKRTLVEALSASDAVAPVQLRAVSGRAALADPQEARAAALRGAAGTPGRLPHFEVLQRAFGPAFDLSQIGAHVGGPAAAASEALGAEAYAVAGRVVFRGEPTLHTAAHEVAHAIQQQRGVSPAGGLGAIGDAYEREADAVADAVVRGESVAALLGAPGTSAVAGAAVQLRQVARTEVRPELEPGDVDAERDGLGVIAGLQQQLRVPVTGAMDDPTVDAIIALQQRESLAEERAGVMTGATWEVLARLGSGGTAATTERGAVAARGSGAVAADQRRRVAAVQRALGRLDPRILGGLRELIARVDQSAQIRFFDALLATDPGELAHFVAAVNAARPAQLERLASAFLEGAAGPRALTGGPEAQRSLVDWNAQGGPAARVPDQLIQAHLADYATSAYLQEGEGEVLAEHYGVAARVLDQPTPSERIIRDNGVTLGSGGTVGHLLFVNGNHYIVLQPVAATAAAYDFIDLEHNKYTRGPATRARGDCLIEGLHLVAHGRLPSREEIAAARAHIASRVDREGVRQLLTAAITSLLAGEFPQGLGPQVFRRLRADEQLWTAFKEAEAAARERQRPAPQREGGAPGASAHEPVIGLPGVSYAGPVKRPTGEVIHRAECEVELINGVPYARLYLTICKEASLGAEQPDGTYAADWKDVQQDLESGKLQISPGSNGVMYVTAGQALRSLKWAAKYVVQHREKERDATQQADQADRDAQGYRDAHAALPWPLRVAWQLVRFLGNQVGLTEPSWPAMADGHATAAAAHRREASEMRGLQSPVIRSYLFPLAELNRITDDAILESEVGKAADPNKDKSYNVDRHAASNQYAFRGGDVSQLAAQARPGSLVTYAWDPQRVTPERSGELHPISDLYAKLGVPFHDPSLSPWTSGSSFAERDKLESIATDYNMYYVTWRQCPELAEDAVVKPDPLLAEAAAMKPYSARAKLTRAFLEQRKIPEPEWARYMEEQILPLASEPMKEHVIASDYERLNRDDNVRASGTPGFGNNYGQWRDDAPARARQLRALGARLDQLLTNGEAPHVSSKRSSPSSPRCAPNTPRSAPRAARAAITTRSTSTRRWCSGSSSRSSRATRTSAGSSASAPSPSWCSSTTSRRSTRSGSSSSLCTAAGARARRRRRRRPTRRNTASTSSPSTRCALTATCGRRETSARCSRSRTRIRSATT